MPSMLHKFGLEFNPFEPSAAGPPLKGSLSPPMTLAEQTRAILDAHQTGRRTKALIVTGEYGSGKTCLLRWLHWYACAAAARALRWWSETPAMRARRFSLTSIRRRLENVRASRARKYGQFDGAATARSRWANMVEWRLAKASSCSRSDSD